VPTLVPRKMPEMWMIIANLVNHPELFEKRVTLQCTFYILKILLDITKQKSY